jgi:AAA+ ATPase superfamily predicted ATPase
MMITTNPYVYNQPLTRREQFSGRKSEIVRIYSRIASDRPQSVSIVGEPRIGKTSLLNWLYHEDSRGDYLDAPTTYLYLLLSLKEQPPGHPDAFFSLMSDTLAKTGQSQMSPSSDGFRHFVEHMEEKDRKFVLFFDDFGCVTQNKAFPLEFFSFMRSMANNYNVAYVTTSSDQLQKLCSSTDLQESPFFNIFTALNLRSFTDEEAREALLKPAMDIGVSLEGEAERILKLAGRLPYLLQLTASLAFDAQVNGKLRMEEVAEKAFKEAREFLNLLWTEEFSEAQRDVLQVISGEKPLKSQNRYAAEELERRGHLKKSGDNYTIGSALLERFVKETGSGGFWKRLFG